MSNHNYSDEKIEVIDPSDDRYKGDDYFNKNSSQNNQNLKTFNQTYSYGCTFRMRLYIRLFNYFTYFILTFITNFWII